MISGKYESCTRLSDFSLKQLLEREFCSLWWITAVHTRRRDKTGAIQICRKQGAYPLAGMIRCIACGRWAPPALGSTTLCVDCCVEAEQDRFLARMDRWSKKDRVEWFALYWRRPMRAEHWLREGMPMPVAQIEDDLTMPFEPDEEDDDGLIPEADLFDGALESDQRWGQTPNYRAALQSLRRCFFERYRDKKNRMRIRFKQHGAGTRHVMLAESQEALQSEIAYYHANGSIVPSARRINKPFDKREKPLPMPGQDVLL